MSRRNSNVLSCFIVLIAVIAPVALHSTPLYKPVQTFAGGASPWAITIADVNGDGKPDVLVANLCGSDHDCALGEVGVYLGNGDGTFQSPLTYSSGAAQAAAIVVADVNGDHKIDVVVENNCLSHDDCGGNGAVGVLFGNGDGTFQVAQTYNTLGYFGVALAIADVTGDGKPDLLVIDSCADALNCSAGGLVGVLINKGNGKFKPVQTYNSGSYAPNSLTVGDFNGDNKPDLAVASSGSSSCQTPGTVDVLLGNGNGTFQAPQTYSTGGCYGRSVAAADVNGDGKLDLSAVSACADVHCIKGSVGVLLGNGDGTFQAAQVLKSLGYSASAIAIADADGNNKPDLIVADYCYSRTTCANNGKIAVLVNKGSGVFKGQSFNTGGFFPNAVAMADVNGDNKVDVLVVNQCIAQGSCADGTVGVLLNNRH